MRNLKNLGSQQTPVAVSPAVPEKQKCTIATEESVSSLSSSSSGDLSVANAMKSSKCQEALRGADALTSCRQLAAITRFRENYAQSMKHSDNLVALALILFAISLSIFGTAIWINL